MTSLETLQANVTNLRNICILAHVDHGKTTISDYLLSANGIISSWQSGQLRFLDSRQDEQDRGITMKSSAVALSYANHLVHLIDSPGHVDFASEVLTALRICDGALVVVDVLEGPTTQLFSLLQNACFEEGLVPVLVLNKIDRLIVEWQMSPISAYGRLEQVLHDINAWMGSMAQALLAEMVEEDATEQCSEEASRQRQLYEIFMDDYFDPSKGNVVFASALDGWGFRCQTFARIFAQTFKIDESELVKALWGHNTLKAGKLVTCSAKGGRKTPLAVEVMLKNVWAVYEACGIPSDSERPKVDQDRVTKISTKLGIRLTQRELKGSEPKALVRCILGRWLDLSTSVFQTVIEEVQNPVNSQARRVPLITKSLSARHMGMESVLDQDEGEDETGEVDYEVLDALSRCDSGEMLTAAIVKMMSYETEAIRHSEDLPLSRAVVPGKWKDRSVASSARLDDSVDEDVEEGERGDVLVGLTRIFSGTLSVGEAIYALPPKYDHWRLKSPASEEQVASLPSSKRPIKVVAERLFFFAGRELIPTKSVKSGNVFGLVSSGLSSMMLKTATLTCDLRCPSLVRHIKSTPPILLTAIEPRALSSLPKLATGLQLLNQVDPAVRVFTQETGEHVLVTAGELHLERCLTDLRNTFAQVSLQVSDPIVRFRETIVAANPQPEYLADPDSGIPQGYARAQSAAAAVLIEAIPLGTQVTKFLEERIGRISRMISLQRAQKLSRRGLQFPLADGTASHIRQGLGKAMQGHRTLAGKAERIVAFGPKNCGPNILVDLTQGGTHVPDEVWHGIISGFQLATLAGPLCQEPMIGVGFAVREVTPSEHGLTAASAGQIVSTMRDSFRKAFLGWSPRLVLAMYSCEVQASADVVGRVYQVLSRRRGRILRDEMLPGSTFFTIKAVIPVAESFGFSEELRKRTSGGATAHLTFSGFELLDVDPFWTPQTAEELEDLGSKADRENIGKVYMEAVRRRKGLTVSSKIVQDAEKQRTLGKG